MIRYHGYLTELYMLCMSLIARILYTIGLGKYV